MWASHCFRSKFKILLTIKLQAFENPIRTSVANQGASNKYFQCI